MVGEELFAGEDVGGDELAAGVGDVEVGAVDGGEAEEVGGVDEGQEVVDFEDEVVGEVGEVFVAAGATRISSRPARPPTVAAGRGCRQRRRRGAAGARRWPGSSRPVMMP